MCLLKDKYVYIKEISYVANKSYYNKGGQLPSRTKKTTILQMYYKFESSTLYDSPKHRIERGMRGTPFVAQT